MKYKVFDTTEPPDNDLKNHLIIFKWIFFYKFEMDFGPHHDQIICRVLQHINQNMVWQCVVYMIYYNCNIRFII